MAKKPTDVKRWRQVNVLTVDPGVDPGWALWRWNRYNEGPLIGSGVIRSDKNVEWIDAMDDVFEKMKTTWYGSSLTHVYCEQPQFFDSQSGRAAARRGAPHQLAHMCGLLHAYAIRCDSVFEYVPVNKWMGNLKEAEVKRRDELLLHRYGLDKRKPEDRKFRGHEADAIGIGLYLKGLF